MYHLLKKITASTLKVLSLNILCQYFLPAVIFAQNIPTKLMFLKEKYSEALEQATERNVAESQKNSYVAQLSTISANNLPTVGLNSAAGINKANSYDNSKLLNSSDKVTNNLSAGISVGQKIWNGGVDSNSADATKVKISISEIDSKIYQQKIINELTKDLGKLINEYYSIQQKMKENAKWLEINTNTHKKAKGGHLNIRDTQQSDRELSVSIMELENTEQQFMSDMTKFNLTYAQIKKPLTKETFTHLIPDFTKLFTSIPEIIPQLNLTNFVQLHSLDAQKLLLQKEGVKVDYKQKKLQEYSPELRASLDLNSSYIDNVNRNSSPLGATLPNWSLTATVGLRFTLNLYNPKGSSLVNESLTQFEQISSNEKIFLNNTELKIHALKTELINIESRIGRGSNILNQSKTILENNEKLFNAGLIDIFQMIKSMQDYYNQEKAQLDLYNQHRSQLLTIFLYSELGQ